MTNQPAAESSTASPAVAADGDRCGMPNPFDPAILWDAVCRTTGDYVVVVDSTGSICFANRVGDGYTTDQVLNRSMLDFTVPESAERLARVVREVFETGELRSLETTVRGISGEHLYFAVRLGPVIEAGRTVGVVVCCENLLPLRTSERTLQHERNLLRRLLDIQERERQLVSYEIHDGLAQYLAGALMHVQAYQHAGRERPAEHELDTAVRLLQAAAEESRRLIGGLRPPALDELGIAAAIDSLVEETRAEVPEVTFVHALPGPRLPPNLEAVIFRIVQESLSNVRKHAAAHAVTVVVEKTGPNVRVLVRDDGQGFDPAAVAEDRFGLEGIRQRCRLNGGEPRIESAPGRGTTIEVILPLPADED